MERNNALKREKWATRSPAERTHSSRVMLLKKYSLTPQDYETMLAAQGGRCANPGCRTERPGDRIKHFHVDHNHDTGEVRALLCGSCNVALGQLGDGHYNNRIFGLYEYAVEHGPPLIGGPDALFALKGSEVRAAA